MLLWYCRTKCKRAEVAYDMGGFFYTQKGERGMKFAEYVVRVTKHAHQQYCDRVEAIGKEELQQKIIDQIEQRDFFTRKGEFLQAGGIWWVYELRAGMLVLVTCWGRSDFDLPKAVGWARLHNDRIDLSRRGVTPSE